MGSSSLGSSSSSQFFTARPSPDVLIDQICTLSFFENYIAHLKATEQPYLRMFPFLVDVVQKESVIKSTLDRLVVQYLSLNPHYDTKDMNRALRQAAVIGDLAVTKLLIYTRRADANALSPSNKTPLDYAMTCKNEDSRKQVLSLLADVSAQPGHALILSSSVAALP